MVKDGRIADSEISLKIFIIMKSLLLLIC